MKKPLHVFMKQSKLILAMFTIWSILADTLMVMTDKKYSPMTNEDDEERHSRLMQKLQVKHDDLFEKIVLAQREDKEEIAKSHACELVIVREMIHLKKHEYKKLKWGEMYRDKRYFKK